MRNTTALPTGVGAYVPRHWHARVCNEQFDFIGGTQVVMTRWDRKVAAQLIEKSRITRLAESSPPWWWTCSPTRISTSTT